MRRLCALFTLLPALVAVSPAPSHAQILSITIAPPVLPVYVQPAIPAPGYIWTPGYWAYGGEGYYWVPGTWVLPPSAGLLWTPGYWGWNDGVYVWNAGYWGPTVGFYGGVNYGYGYGGVGFEGGMWRGGVFVYNRAVSNFGSVRIASVYNRPVIVNNNHVAFNGGTGGLAVRPTPGEMAAMHEHHIAATSMQMQHEHTASTVRENFASVNHGAPSVAATAKPGQFSGKGVVAAHGAPAGAGGLAHGPGAVGNANATHAPGAPAGNANAFHAPGAPNAAAAHAPGAPGATPAGAANAASHPNPTANASLHPVAPAPTGAPQGPGAAQHFGGPAQPHPQAAVSPQQPGGAPRPMAAAPRAAAPAARAPAGRPAANGHRPG